MRTIPADEQALPDDDRVTGVQGTGEEPASAETPRRRKRWRPAVLVVVLAALAAVVWFIVQNGSGETEETSAATLAFSEVVIRDLEQIEELSGTLGFDAGEPIASRFSGTLTASAEAGEIVAQTLAFPTRPSSPSTTGLWYCCTEPLPPTAIWRSATRRCR